MIYDDLACLYYEIVCLDFKVLNVFFQMSSPSILIVLYIENV